VLYVYQQNSRNDWVVPFDRLRSFVIGAKGVAVEYVGLGEAASLTMDHTFAPSRARIAVAAAPFRSPNTSSPACARGRGRAT
jgi:hypothetical protein